VEDTVNLGPRLVIPGTIICSSLLAVLLFILSAGTSYPPPTVVMAAEAAPATPPPADLGNKEKDGSVTAVDSSGSAQPSGECQVSERFPARVRQWCNLISAYADKNGLDPNLVSALIWQESGGNPQAISKSGAVGLMQVMPKDGQAANFMCVNGPCFSTRPTTSQLLDPEYNISYGTRMLAQLINKQGNVRDALKAYGPMNVGYYYADKVWNLYQQYGR
jgi:soluble lytic murein transglycosylase-like protein